MLKSPVYVLGRIRTVFIAAVLLFAVLSIFWNGSPVLAADPAIPESQGRIDRIDYDNEVVINDRLFRLTPGTQYYSALGAHIRGSEFVEGSTVAYSLEPDSKIVLTLWKLK
jgi:hypothetical protein